MENDRDSTTTPGVLSQKYSSLRERSHSVPLLLANLIAMIESLIDSLTKNHTRVASVRMKVKVFILSSFDTTKITAIVSLLVFLSNFQAQVQVPNPLSQQDPNPDPKSRPSLRIGKTQFFRLGLTQYSHGPTRTYNF